MPTFTRVALEGTALDGRKISRKQIQDMADQYDPDKRHGARIWLEHIRGLFADSLFSALGDVLSLKTEEVDVEGEKKLGLYAELHPTEKLTKMNQDRQKIYTSIEMDVDYADTGKAYLTGLAVTDSPASQGTEMLKFSQKNNFEQLKNKQFSSYIETQLEFSKPKQKFSEKILGLFSKHQKTDDERFSDHEESMILISKELDKTQVDLSRSQKEFDTYKHHSEAKITALTDKVKALETFKSTVEKASTNPRIPKVKGGDGSGNSTVVYA